MSWDGHEFLEASRDDERWFKAKEIIAELKGATFEVIKYVLVQIMTEKVSIMI